MAPSTIIAVDASVALALPTVPTSTSSADAPQATSADNTWYIIAIVRPQTPSFALTCASSCDGRAWCSSNNSSAVILGALSDQVGAR